MAGYSDNNDYWNAAGGQGQGQPNQHQSYNFDMPEQFGQPM